MKDEIKEILDKLSNRKQETLLQGIRECQLKDIEHPFITKEEYIDKILDYIATLQEENEKYKLIIKALQKHYTDREYYEDNEFLRQLLSVTDNDMVWLKRMAGEENKQ